MYNLVNNPRPLLFLISHLLPITHSPNDIGLNSNNSVINPVFTPYQFPYPLCILNHQRRCCSSVQTLGYIV
jgi:hypothetical protein